MPKSRPEIVTVPPDKWKTVIRHPIKRVEGEE